MKKIIFLVLAAFMSSIGIMAREDEWSTPIPKVDIELLPAKRLNYGVIIPFRWHNECDDFDILVGNRSVGDDATYAILDSGEKVYMYIDNHMIESKNGIPHLSYLFLPTVPWKVNKITTLVIEGRAPNSPKSTKNNYYGEYAYKLGSVDVPKVKLGPTGTSAFLHPDFTLGEIKVVTMGSDLVLEYTLTNNSSKDKKLYVDSFKGFAYDEDGNKYSMSTESPDAFPSGIPVKVSTTIHNGSGITKFTGIEVPFRDPSLKWDTCCLRLWNFKPELTTN